MTAVDTNGLVRLLTADDPKQASGARRVFAAGPVRIAKTVLLETHWVLRSLYEFEDSAIRDAFTNLLGVRNVYVEDQQALEEALALTKQGIEFANALHLASRPLGARFVSFDRSFVRRAGKAGVTGIATVPDRS